MTIYVFDGNDLIESFDEEERAENFILKDSRDLRKSQSYFYEGDSLCNYIARY